MENGVIRDQVTGQRAAWGGGAWKPELSWCGEWEWSIFFFLCHCKRTLWIRHFQSQAFISHSGGWRDQDQDVGSFGAWWGPVSAFQMAALFLCHHMVAGLDGGQLSYISLLWEENSAIITISCAKGNAHHLIPLHGNQVQHMHWSEYVSFLVVAEETAGRR